MAKSHKNRRELTLDEKRSAEQLKRLWEYNKDRLGLTQETMARRYRTKQGEPISQGAIGHYLNGKIPLNAWACSQFADALQISVTQFAPESVIKELSKLADETKVEYYFEVAYYSRSSGSSLNDFSADERFMLPRSLAAKANVPHDKLIIIECKYSSMEPAISKGDYLVVRRDKTTIESGKIYALDCGSEQRIHRVYRKGKQNLLLVSDNPDIHTGPKLITTGDLSDIKVIGEVWLRFGAIS